MKIFYNQKLILFVLTILSFGVQAQITVAPLSCYPQYSTASEMNNAAEVSGGESPFATWKGAYDYAIANSILTIDFVEGTYSTSLSGVRTDWGDADGGFVLPDGMTVNGNGAVIDNAPVGSSQICFATLSSNSSINGFVFKQLSGNLSGGALFVPSSADNWTINDCDFYNCNQATDALIVNMGSTSTGNITGCDFYGNSNPGATYPASSGLSSSSALDISGSLTSDLNITNTTFSCNFRNVSGGAVKIQDDVHVDFEGCTFYRNEANSSRGGAVDVGSNAEVLFSNTSFIENFTSGSGSPYGGALALQSGSTVTISGCNFRLNTAVEDGGALYLVGGAANTTTVNISGTIFEENSNSGGLDGGALFVQNFTDVEIDNCLFLNNTAGDKGGAIWVDGTSTKDLDILNSTFVNNNAGSGEATIHVNYLNTNTDVYIDNSIICDNNSAEDIESEYFTALTTLNNSYWDNDKGTLNLTGTNTNPYSPNYDVNWNETSGAGWTGTYTQASGSGSCPSPPATSDNCVDQGSISGITFDDSDNNGIDNGIPLDGVMIELFNCDGSSTGRTITTGLSGEFYFGNLDNGNCYYLAFTAPGGFNTTSQDAAGSSTTNDSDVNQGSNQSPQITINTSTNSIDEDDDTNNETHYITVDAGFTSNPLPIEISIFRIENQNCQSVLIWETVSELGNDYFEIERSIDGRSFEAIGIVQGSGTTNLRQQYKFIDDQVLKSIDNYYRLKQVDVDGLSSYSKVRSIKLETCNEGLSINTVFPNPFNNRLNLIINSLDVINDGQIEFYDVLGSMVISKNIQLQNDSQITLSTESLPVGTYFVRFSSANQQSAFVKIFKH